MTNLELKQILATKKLINEEIYETPALPDHKFIIEYRIIENKSTNDNNNNILVVILKHLLPNGEVDQDNFRMYTLKLEN
ncbi:MAG: hypothetical protein ACTSPY_01755 [Candidatus Helarchaeota archaeon]